MAPFLLKLFGQAIIKWLTGGEHWTEGAMRAEYKLTPHF